MKKLLVIFTMFLLLLCSYVPAYAVEDPLSKPNNEMGIHILFPDELEAASKLVNSNGGAWGYVTIPIQIGDRDIDRWQAFMDACKKYYVIPLVRLATEPDPLNTSVWRRPSDYDIIDFANFLDSLSWPTKNRYVILFNEVNRSDEWGGVPPSPTEYAEIVKYSYDVFKKRSENFYIILSGMDAAAPDDYIKYMSGFTYLEDLMKDPEIVASIDGFSSHSYPNPEFSDYPSETKKVSVSTYRHEYDLINKDSSKKIPAFITETGWSDKTLPGSVISKYYTQTFNNIWNEDTDKIVAITPFLLNSIGGPFDNFSLLKNGEEKVYYKTLADLPKEQGRPSVSNTKAKVSDSKGGTFGKKSFSEIVEGNGRLVSPFAKLYFKTIMGLQ